MFKVDAALFIKKFYQVACPWTPNNTIFNDDGSYMDKGVLFKFKCSMYGDVESQPVQKTVAIIVCGQTRVFAHVGSWPLHPTIQDLEKLSTPPSDWVDTLQEFFTKTYFSMSEDIKSNSMSEISCIPIEIMRVEALIKRDSSHEEKLMHFKCID